MTEAQLQQVCQKYRTRLQRVKPQCHNLEQIAGELADLYAHVCWMLPEIPKLYAAGKVEKAMRWLGFVQGVLWSCKLYSIQEMAEDNRGEVSTQGFDPDNSQDLNP